MATPLVVGLSILGVGLGGRTLFHIFRAGRGGADKFVRGGFRTKMDRNEALQVLGLK